MKKLGWFGTWTAALAALTLAYARPATGLAQESGTSAARQAEHDDPEAEALALIRRLFDGVLESDTAAIRDAFAPGFPGLVSAFRGQDGVARVNFTAMDEWLAGLGRTAAGSLEEKYTVARTHVDDGLVTVVTPYGFYFNGNFSHCGVDVFLVAETEAGWKIVGLADTRRRQDCEDWIDE